MDINEKLLKVLKSLISDIKAMQERPQTYPEQFGPFSDYEEQGEPYLENKVVIEWPNLAISLEEAKKVIDEHEKAPK